MMDECLLKVQQVMLSAVSVAFSMVGCVNPHSFCFTNGTFFQISFCISAVLKSFCNLIVYLQSKKNLQIL